jgi:hypothetical protein
MKIRIYVMAQEKTSLEDRIKKEQEREIEGLIGLENALEYEFHTELIDGDYFFKRKEEIGKELEELKNGTWFRKFEIAVIHNSDIPHRSRFVPDPSGEHSYQGAIYDSEGMLFEIEKMKGSEIYDGIDNLIIGVGAHLSYYDDLPRDFLTKEYKEKSRKLKKITNKIIDNTRNYHILEVDIDISTFITNRSQEFKDCFIGWSKNSLLYAPLGYESEDYGDGRKTALPEVKNIKKIFPINTPSIPYQ